MNMWKYGTASSFLDRGDGDLPYKLRTIPITHIAFDDNVKSLRGASRNYNARRCFIFFDYGCISDAIADFPEYEDKLRDNCGWGNLPFQRFKGDIIDCYNNKDSREGQIGIYIDIDKKMYAILAGTDATVLDMMNDSKFPFMKNKETYMPIIMSQMYPNEDWIYKRGLGHYSSQLNNIDSITGNIALKSFLQDNVGIDILTVKEGAGKRMKEDIQTANMEAQTGAGRAIIVSEIDSIDGARDVYGVQPLSPSAQWGVDKKQFIDKWNDDDIISSGINMYDVNNNPYKTSTSINAETVASEAIVDTIEIVNSREWKFMIEILLDGANKIKDDVPIPTDDFDTSNELAMAIMQPTFKHFKKILKDLKIIIETEFDNTVKNKDLVKNRNILSVLPMIPQGSRASALAIKEALSISGINLVDSDFSLPAQEPPKQQGQATDILLQNNGITA
ncbi:MAG: hypothetical protein E6R13_02650 [Spirochaetes bacterium]|nr:MAG: hypothetical protein E6R13_02650 [Spirochaetota bacterium]